MFRLPQDRRSRIQFLLVTTFLALFAGGVWTGAEYLRRTARNAALQEAVIANDVAGARRLLAEGAEPNGRIGFRFFEEEGTIAYRPLEHAIDQGHLPMIKLLVESGADLYIRYHYQDAFEEGWYERTALDLALRQCQIEAAHYLVHESGKLDLAQEDVDLLLLLTAECGDAALAEYWIENGANPITTMPPASPFGVPQSPLHYAVYGDNLDVIRLLVRHGADVNLESTSYPRGTPLHLATNYGSVETIRLLLELGADPNQPSRGYTPLYAAVEREDAHVVRLLLDHGADPTLPDAGGETAYALAERLDKRDMMRVLSDAISSSP